MQRVYHPRLLGYVILISSLGAVGCSQDVRFAQLPSALQSLDQSTYISDDFDPDDPDRWNRPPILDPDEPIAQPEPIVPPDPPAAEPEAPIALPEPAPEAPPVVVPEPTPEPPVAMPEPAPPVTRLPEPLPVGNQVALLGVVVAGSTGKPVVDSSGSCVRTSYLEGVLYPECESLETQLELSQNNKAVYFDVDSAELTEAAQVSLSQWVAEAKAQGVFFNVNIVGPIALFERRDGKAEQISAERAAAVWTFVKEELGLSEQQKSLVTLKKRNGQDIVSCQAQGSVQDLTSCLARFRDYRRSEFSTSVNILERLLVEW